MTTFTIADIRSWNPCYDPSRHLPESWEGTALDLLSIETIPPSDRLRVVLREELVDARTLRRFADWCVRSVPYLANDPRWDADAAWDAARAAGAETDWDAAWAAADTAAWDAAGTADWDGVRSAAWDAAWDAAGAAGEAADWESTWAAAEEAAWTAAWAAAGEAQVAKLREMLSEPCDP